MPFGHLPVELVRYILELAASHRPTAMSLCVVSKEVHRWSIALLYHTVTLPRLRTFEQLFQLFARPDHPTHIDLIKNLYVSRSLSLIRYSLRGCTTLKNLVLSHYDSAYISEIPATVTHLTIQNCERFLCHASYDSVTHLYLPNYEAPSRYHTWTPAKLPRLTHIVWGMIAAPDPAELSLFLTPLVEKGFDKLRVIGLQVVLEQLDFLPSEAERLEAVFQASPFRDNEKVVVLPRYPSFDESVWSGWFEGGEDVWETAERLLSLKVRPIGNN